MAIQHIYMARMCLHGYQQIRQVIPFKFVPHFGKAEAAYRHHRQATFLHGVAAHCKCIPHQIFLRYYLQVQLMYLNELYTECSETARTCANSGYQHAPLQFLPSA